MWRRRSLLRMGSPPRNRGVWSGSRGLAAGGLVTEDCLPSGRSEGAGRQQWRVPELNPGVSKREDAARSRVCKRLAEEVQRVPDLGLQVLNTTGLGERAAAFAHAVYDAAVRHWITIEYLVLGKLANPDRPLDVEVAAAMLAEG